MRDNENPTVNQEEVMRRKVPRITPRAVSLQTVEWILNTGTKHFITQLALTSIQNRESARLIR